MPIVAIVGAGSMVFTRQVVSDLLQTPDLGDDLVLSLCDIDGERLATARAMVERLVGESGRRARVRAAAPLAEALAGADFVVSTIQVGGYAATRLDFDIPARYGLRQTIADTVGVGGIFRALRTLPAVVEICRAMQTAAAPGARLLNYTNPMGMVMLGIAHLAPVEAYGLCHSVPHTARSLAGYLAVDPGRLSYLAAGVNHQAWFLRLEVDGEDAYPALALAAARPEVYDRDRVRFELMARLGVFVSESSEHNAEYVPYFMHHPAEVDRLAVPVGEYLRRSERLIDTFQGLPQALAAGERLLQPRSDEYAPRLIGALVTGRPATVQVNVVNRGLVANLPADSAVEVPATAAADGIRPEAVGALPIVLAALNGAATTAQQLVVEAVRSGRREAVDEAVMLDPNAAACLTLDQMAAMVDDLVAAHGRSLPRLSRRRAWAVSLPRAAGPAARADADLRLRDFDPVSRLEVPVHLVERARFPVVDMHNHSQWYGDAWEVEDVPALVAEMDRAGVAARVDLDGGVGDQVKRHVDHFRGPYPDRFAVFAKFDWGRYLDTDGFGERMARDLRDAAAAGAEGLKVWKDVGLTRMDPAGRRLATSDPRLAPIWQAAAELGLPILIHTADPVAFFDPLDRRNERYEELANHPDWHFHGPGFPSFAQVQDEFEALVAANPRTTFVAAHVASHAEDLARVAGLVRRYPNLYVDIAARHAELGRQPNTARRFLRDHADRVVFGLDHWPAVADDYRVVFRMLETNDDHFDYRSPADGESGPGKQGRWRIYGLGLDDDALRRIYYGTALTLLPRLTAAVEAMAAASA